MNYYLVRIGEGSKYIDEAQKHGFIAIGWDELPELNQYNNFDQIKEALADTSYNYNPTQISAQGGQIYRFGVEMKPGDTVLSPLGSGEYLTGIVGDYYFEDKPKDRCTYKHRRKITWNEKILKKEDMSTSLAYALGATLTIYSLNKYANELTALISGEPLTPADKPQKITDIILIALMDMDGREFEVFIKHLLDVLGFQADTTRYVKDKGIDVVGVLNAEGLAEVKLQIQTKRQTPTINSRIVRELKGSLNLDEHGCIITTATFSKDAIEEASRTGQKAIKLIDGYDLAGLILKHYDYLDEDYKKLLGIKRKKDFNIEDQFEPTELHADNDKIETEEVESEPDWDTLVCAAKEEGFQRAFMEQKAWWAVRINVKNIKKIKYLAVYQVTPISKITYYAEVDRIELYKDTNKYILYFKSSPIKLDKPVGLGKNSHLKPQGPKYTKLDTILKAKTIDDIWG